MESASKKDFFKFKVAIFFGYNGLPFHGLQKYFYFLHQSP